MKRMRFLIDTRRDATRRKPAQGFSLIELMIVVAIIMSIAVAATPSMVNLISSARMRGTMSTLSTFLQSARGDAVRENKARSIYITSSNSEYMVYKADMLATAPAMTDASVEGLMPMGKQVVYIGTPTGAGAPSALDNTTTFGSSTITPQNSTISWNSRGIPCVIVGSACTTSPSTGSNAFVWYFVFQPPLGSNRWGALSVSPAGRVKAWYWDGASWTN